MAMCDVSFSHDTVNSRQTAGLNEPPGSKQATSASLCKHCSLDSKFNLGKATLILNPVV